MSLRTIKDKVILQPVELDKTNATIALPETYLETGPRKFKVISVGNEVSEVRPGDEIIATAFVGFPITYEGIKYRIAKFDELWISVSANG